MAAVAPLIGHFDGGEVSPLFYGRVDSDRYKSSLALCLGWIPTLQGALARRPGTMYIDPIKDSTNKARLIPFEFSTTQAYILEFGDKYVRFYANYGQVQSGGDPLELVTTYAQADIANIRFTQSADTLYLFHSSYPTMKLERFSQTNWQLVELSYIDGPYQSINTTSNTLAPSATTGDTVTITIGPQFTVAGCANNGSGLIRVNVTGHGLPDGQRVVIAGIVGTVEANGTWIIAVVDADHFDLKASAFVHTYSSGGKGIPIPTDPQQSVLSQVTFGKVGSPIRLEIGGTWGWAIINAVGSVDPFSFTVDVQQAFGGTDPTTSWTFGAFWPGASFFDIPANFPSCGGFHEDRLAVSGTPAFPQRIDGSKSSDYGQFAPSDFDGTVKDNNAISFNLNANDVNQVEWISSEEKGLLAGAVAAEWVMRPSLASEALTPTNVSAKRSTRWGSTSIQALQVGKATLHVQRGSRKVRELMYFFDIDGWRDTDITELAEHITGTGVTDMVYQSVPYPILWLLRNDGVLLGASYDRDMAQLRVGWHQHVLGGVSDAAGSPPVIESIAVIPSPDGTRDDLWMIVKRYINGSVVRTIEFMTKVFEGIDLQQDAFHLDCGLKYDNPLTISGVTRANPAVVTVTGHGLSSGDKVRIDNVVGLNIKDAKSVSSINGKVFTATVIDANTFSIGIAIDSSIYFPYVSGGQARKLVSTISGLDYLEGESVAIYADGADHPAQVVSSGAIHLEIPSAVVAIGYNFSSDGKLLRLEAGSRNGTSIGKTRRTHRVGVMLHRSAGLQMGPSFDELDPIEFRTQGVDESGRCSPLFTGIQTHEMEFDYDFDNNICFRVSNSLPCTLLAVMPQLETQDRA